jgi:hypothetical protein
MSMSKSNKPVPLGLTEYRISSDFPKHCMLVTELICLVESDEELGCVCVSFPIVCHAYDTTSGCREPSKKAVLRTC